LSHLSFLFLAIYLFHFWSIAETVPIPLPDELSQTPNQRLKKLVASARSELDQLQQDTDSNSKLLGSAWGHLASIYHIHGWSPEALVCYQHATQFDDQNFRWLYLLGRLTYTTYPKKAVKALSQAIEIDPQYTPSYVYLVQSLRRTGKVETAKRKIEKLKQLAPSNPLAYLWSGELAFSEGLFEQASQQLQIALKYNPNQNEARTKLIQTYFAQGDLESANRYQLYTTSPLQYQEIEDPIWESVMDLGLSSRWFIERANRYMRQQAFQRAAKEFSMIISVSDNDPEIWFNYGICLYHIKQYTTAITILESALALQTRLGNGERKTDFQKLQAECHHYLGLIYAQHDKFNQATANHQKAIKLIPSNTVYRQELAQFYWKMKMYQAAAEQYRKIIKSEPKDEKAIYRIGLVTLQKGKLDEAKSYFNQLISINPNHTYAHGALGLIFFQLGEWKKAIVAYEMILSIEPDHQQAQSMLKKIRSGLSR